MCNVHLYRVIECVRARLYDNEYELKQAAGVRLATRQNCFEHFSLSSLVIFSSSRFSVSFFVGLFLQHFAQLEHFVRRNIHVSSSPFLFITCEMLCACVLCAGCWMRLHHSIVRSCKLRVCEFTVACKIDADGLQLLGFLHVCVWVKRRAFVQQHL